MMWLFVAIVMVFAYLIGSVNSSIVISRFMGAGDIRNEGSGNAGATNMLRTHGKKAGALTLVFDMLKGVIVILVCMLLTYILTKSVTPTEYISSMIEPTLFGQSVSTFELQYLLPNLKYIGALFVIIGHDFPVFFGFKGGKGIATSGAVILMLNWQIGLLVLAFTLLIMAITRYVSLASILASIAYPLVLLAFMIGSSTFNIVYLICAILIGAIAVIRHKANIQRLMTGTESKLGQKKEDCAK